MTRVPLGVDADIDVSDADAAARSSADSVDPGDDNDLRVIDSDPQSSLHTLHRHANRLIARGRAFQERAPRLIAILRIGYYPLALLLVAYFAYDAFGKINLDTIRVWPLVGSYFASLVWWLCLSFGWSMLITEKVHLRQVSAWCRTQVARYFPGGIWAPIARATTVDGRVRDKVAAVGAENVIVLCAALATGGAWASVHNPVWIPAVLIVLVPLIGAGWLTRHSQVSRGGVIRALLIYCVGFFFYGLAGIWSQVAVSGFHHPTYPLYIAGASCVAWAIGLVVVFAPGGVGVREVVYVWMLSGLTYSQADLRAAAVTSRLASVFAELTILAVVSLPAVRRARPRGSKADTAADAETDTETLDALPTASVTPNGDQASIS